MKMAENLHSDVAETTEEIGRFVEEIPKNATFGLEMLELIVDEKRYQVRAETTRYNSPEGDVPVQVEIPLDPSVATREFYSLDDGEFYLMGRKTEDGWEEFEVHHREIYPIEKMVDLGTPTSLRVLSDEEIVRHWEEPETVATDEVVGPLKRAQSELLDVPTYELTKKQRERFLAFSTELRELATEVHDERIAEVERERQEELEEVFPYEPDSGDTGEGE